jgi:cytochrome P450
MLVRALLTAGVDTTVHTIGAVLLSMIRFPEQWQLLRADPRLARGAFQEAIRIESPVQIFFRTTTRPVELAGVAIPEGEKVLTFLGAANRDPRRWEDPDRYDIARKTIGSTGHVGFGSGIHVCVGQLLAALEVEVLLVALADKVAAIEPAGTPVRCYNNTLRGLASLPIRLHAA